MPDRAASTPPRRLCCPRCGQRFVTIFTEFVDWSGGDDSQYHDIVPVTPGEAAGLAGIDPDRRLTAELGARGTGRRRLASAWPSGRPARIRWEHGPLTVLPGN